MTRRTEQLKDSLLAIEPEICPERALIITESWKTTEGQPILARRSSAFAQILGEMSVYIRPNELIVGNQASKPRAAPIFPEFGVDWIEAELEDLPRRTIDRFGVTPETQAALLDVCKYWRGRTYSDLVVSLTHLALPDQARFAFDWRTSSFNQAISNLSRISTGDGHIIANYETVLRRGLLDLIAESRQHASRLDPARSDWIQKKLFYDAVVTVLEAAIGFARRFAVVADALASSEEDRARRRELEEIADVCRQVPAKPARNFREALQSYWFTHLLIHVESNGHSVSPGRFDQYLYPYYATDLAEGRLTRDQALELVECFWIKCNEMNKVREWAYTEFMSGYPLFQTVTLGGQTRDGQDAVNDLSYACLEATANLKLAQPTAVVRVHDGTPDEFLMTSAECLTRHGGGMPGFFNDEVALPLLMRVGVTLEDARDWCVMGCSEPQVAGRFNNGTGGVCYVNLLKVLEIALNGGTNPAAGKRPCPEEKDLRTFTSFGELRDAWHRQLSYYLGLVPLLDNITSSAYAELTPTPFLSTLVDHRIEIGRDISQGGPPNYHNLMLHCYGLANVADSLVAIKKLVFEERRLSGTELAEALQGNFAGRRGEEIRQILLNHAPKFGNDDDEVDLLARDLASELAHEMIKYQPLRGGCYTPTTQSLTANVPSGARVGATPDGRRAGEPLADNNSPSAGADTNGPTAVLRSVAKLDHVLIGNGTILNLRLHPSALDGTDRLRKFVAMVRTYFDLKGFQVQFNVVSTEMLRDAQINPDKYRGLVVKVAGYSALFSTLDRRLQDQIIARTAHYIG